MLKIVTNESKKSVLSHLFFQSYRKNLEDVEIK